jgi:drug/metabolite transporter (DMT)-like permease
MPDPSSSPADQARARAVAAGTRIAAPAFVLLWSSAFIAGAIGLRSAPPLLLTSARFAAAGAILAVTALVTRAPWPRGRLLLNVVIAGLLVQAAQFGGFYWAMSLGLPAALTALVQGLTPVVTAVAAWLLAGERTRPLQRLGFGLGTAGVVLAVAGRIDLHAASARALIPAAVGLAGAGLGLLYQQRFCAAMDLRSGTATQLLVSVPVLGLMTVLIEHLKVSHPLPLAASLAWLVLVNSIGTFMLLYVMLRHRSASQVSSLFFLTPSVTAILAYVFLGQSLGWLAIAGLVISAAGVTLTTRGAGSRGSLMVRWPAGALKPLRLARSRPGGSRSGDRVTDQGADPVGQPGSCAG